MPKTTLEPDSILRGLVSRWTVASQALARRYPGQSHRRQPIHTVYGGAHLFRADVARKIGAVALRSLETHAPDAATLARALNLPGGPEIAETVHRRIREKLEREPVEDFRVDFEDGYGHRSGEEEDGHAVACAEELAKGMAAGSLPPFIGIRVKSFSDESVRDRALRTTDIVLTELIHKTGGKLPDNFVVCLAKPRHAEHVAVFADVLGLLERRLGLPAGAVKIELMIETAQSIFDDRGSLQLMHFADSAKGRCVAAHFGTYDYTAALGVTAAHQRMDHPACTTARLLMQIAYAGTGIFLSDGATTVLPIPPHSQRSEGPPLTPDQIEENRRAVHAAWRRHFDDVWCSLGLGFFQGWDLHPAQLVSRYAAVYAFYREALLTSAQRLRFFVEEACRAREAGGVFDDAATGQGLLNFFLRALSSGAIGEDEAVSLTGLTPIELQSRSFLSILDQRRGPSGR